MEVHRRLTIVVGQHEVVEVEQRLKLLREAHRLEQVLQPDGAPRHLVLVGRSDTAPGGADLLRAARRLARRIQRRVVRQDQRASLGDAQPRHDARHAGRLELTHLVDQCLRRNHHAVADKAVDVLPQNARGNEMQHGLLAADDERVPCVVTALEAHHALRAIGQPVDDLSLAFVAPLGSDDDNVGGHDSGYPFTARTCQRPRRLTSTRVQPSSLR